ncbi:MAG: DNA-binding protein [Candidatus Nanoarchaeia archaeon]|nr:DNA-binding protein [Candidatus Nanoarchaeia archaeon]
MNDIEEIKRKKLEELKKQQQNSSDDYQFQQQIMQLESMVKRALTKKALERYGNIKTAHPELAIQLITLLGQAISTGRINKVDDEALKNLLKRIQPKKDRFKIIRK